MTVQEILASAVSVIDALGLMPLVQASMVVTVVGIVIGVIRRQS